MINWDFLLNILAARDFSFYWISQINNSLSSFKVGILINRVPLIYMSTSLNLGREIPFSLALILLLLCSLMHLTLVLFTSCPLVAKDKCTIFSKIWMTLSYFCLLQALFLEDKRSFFSRMTHTIEFDSLNDLLINRYVNRVSNGMALRL